jgi:hypothetical protein
MEVVVKTTTSLENEPLRLGFEGGGMVEVVKTTTPSKTSPYGSVSREVVGGGCFSNHLSRKRAGTLGFEGGGWR